MDTNPEGEATRIQCFSSCVVELKDGKPVKVNTAKTGIDWAAAVISVTAIVFGVVR